jgi:hypothetical protein
VFDAVVDTLSSPGQLACLPGTEESRLTEWHKWLDGAEITISDYRTAIISGFQALYQG